MSRATQNKIYRTFVKGLITEASELTYPEDASINEDNCVIFRKGNRSRRLGIDFEDGNNIGSYGVSQEELAFSATKIYRWESVANNAEISFLVHQLGLTLYFYDLSASSVGQGLKPFTVDLSGFVASNADNPGYSEVAMASGKGYLFVVGEKIEPFLIEYRPDSDTITTNRIYIQIRDFTGVEDNLANDEEPTTLSNAHKYNLMNQGWIDPHNEGTGDTVSYFDNFGKLATYPGPTTNVISSYFSAHGRYPGNNKQWWVARNSTDGSFDPELLEKFFSGTNRAPRGHFIVDAFYIDRSSVSGVSGLPVESTQDRPVTVAFFAGRVWYALNSTVYFSQVLDNKGKAGMCYQEADPTSEDISDLIATDGGVIPIPEMGRAVKLVPVGAGIVVFGNNGIWYVSGTDSGFTATDISVSKLNPIGTESPNSIIEAEGQIFWWSKVGIMAMSQKQGMFGTVEGVFDRTNISENTIQSFYVNDIPEEAKKTARGIYDPATNTIQWMFRSGNTPHRFMFDRILNLDLTLQSFYPWTIETVGPYISSAFLTPNINELENSGSIRSSFLKYLTIVPIDDDNYGFTFSYFYNTDFVDWKSYDNQGVPYMSFVETGYELNEDAMRKKQAPVIFTYFRRTEENFVVDGEDYTTDKPSSCKFQVKWDWASTQASNKWSTKVEAYRHRRLPMFVPEDLTFDTGYPIVVSRNKVRGNGKAIQFRFESDEAGKNFDLLGWAVHFQGNTQP